MAKPTKSALAKEARLTLSNPVGYCGHHCDFCWLAKWCGGCRSDYDGSSYATVCESGTCPNVVCAQEKGLDGCYLCDDLINCKKGYYSKTNEYTAKATALFIKKHGEECYTATLKKAIESGKKYAKAFDKTGSVENALALLESYI